MKKLLCTLALLLGLTSIGTALPPSSYYGLVQDTVGHTVSNAVILVYTGGSCTTTCTLATIYSDYGLSHVINQTTNPIVSAADGSYSFFVDASVNGNVDLSVTERGQTIVKSHFTMPGGNPGGGGGGAGGFGTVVTSNIQTTIDSVGTAGTGAPIVVPQGFGGSGNFTNPNRLPVLNFTSSPDGYYDKNGVQPVDIFGVRHDGTAITCNITANNPQITCSGANFTSADVGKLILLYNAGPADSSHGGILSGAITASGGTGGTPGVQALITNGGGCAYPERGWVTVASDGTIHSGSVVTAWKAGFGCTSLPTTATVSTVSGTVTLTGPAYYPVDLPTSIVSVQSATQVTVADTPSTSQGGETVLYGTDDYLALTAACSGRVAFGGPSQSGGHYTHVGISLISQGVVCDGNNTWIQGAGYAPLINKGEGSSIVYVGKNASGKDGIWITSQGWGAKLTDMGLKGNSWGRPRGLVISQGNTPHGNGNSSNGIYEHLWIGWMWGDGAGTSSGPQLSEGIFADVSTGNGDYNNFLDIHMAGLVHGIDGTNDQAILWIFRGNLEIESVYTGICAFGGGTFIQSYYTESNDTDIQLGPCVSGSGIANLDIQNYGGESSAKNIVPGAGLGAGDNSVNFTVHSGGVGQPGQYEDPSNNTINLGYPINTGYITLGDGTTLGSGTFNFGTTTGGERPAKLVMPQIYGGTFEPQLILNGPELTQLTPPSFSTDGCGVGCNNRVNDFFMLNGNKIYADALEYQTVPIPWSQQDLLGVTRDFGSIYTYSPRPPGTTDTGTGNYGVSLATVGTTGSTTYNYQITCSDQLGNETAASSNSTGSNNPTAVTYSIATGNATLSTSNYIKINALWGMRGCAYYNLYGDNGIGGTIGYLTTVSSVQFGDQGLTFFDEGQYTKTSRVPPTVSNSGFVYAENGFKVGPNSNEHFIGVNDLVTNGVGIPNSINTAQIGYTSIGSTPQSSVNTFWLAVPSIPTSAATVVDCKVNIATAAGNVACAVYDSNGSGGSPGTVLCQNGTGVSATTGLNTVSISGCPTLTANHMYYTVFGVSSASAAVTYNTPNTSGFYYIGSVTCCTSFSTQTFTNNAEQYTAYLDVTYPTAVWGPVYSSTNQIPATYLPAAITPSYVNSIAYAAQFSGADCGAKINAALATSSNVVVTPACGNISTQVNITSSNVGLHFEAGTYNTSASIAIASGASHVDITCDESVLTTATNGLNQLLIGDGTTLSTYVKVAGCTFGNTGTSTGTAITVNKTNNIVLDNVNVGSYAVGLFAEGASYATTLSNFNFGSCSSACILLNNGTNGTAAELVVHDGYMSATGSGVSFEWVDGGGVYFTNVSILNGSHGIEVVPGTSNGAIFGFFTNVAADSATNSNWYIAPSSSGLIKHLVMTNCWGSSSSGGAGVTIGGTSTTTIDSIEWNAGRVVNNYSNGIELLGGGSVFTNIHIRDGYAQNNSTHGSALADGINIGAGVTHFSIVGVTTGPATGASNLQAYGIIVNTGASDYYIITNNDTVGNVTGGVLDSGSGSHKVVTNNL